MQFEIDDEQIQSSAKKELEIAVSGLIKDTITGYQFTAKLREECEERVEDLYEKIETPYLVDIARAIYACDKA